MTRYTFNQSGGVIYAKIAGAASKASKERQANKALKVAQRKKLAKKLNPKMDWIQDSFQDTVFGGVPSGEKRVARQGRTLSAEYRKKSRGRSINKPKPKRRR